MQVHESLTAKFSKLEELLGIIQEFDCNHKIEAEKIPLVTEAVTYGLNILSELMNPKLLEGSYDLDAINWLVSVRVMFKDAKGDLSLPWNNPDPIPKPRGVGELRPEEMVGPGLGMLGDPISRAQYHQDFMSMNAEHGISGDTPIAPTGDPVHLDFEGILHARQEHKKEMTTGVCHHPDATIDQDKPGYMRCPICGSTWQVTDDPKPSTSKW